MAINIQSLFSDIIETPAQRQERLLGEGVLRGRELTGGLTGLARTQAPLVAALTMQMPQRQEAMRRGAGGMLGLDVKTDSERLQDIIRDPSIRIDTSEGKRTLAGRIREFAPEQALALIQAATEQETEEQDRERRRTVQDLQVERLEQQIEAADTLQERNAREQTNYESLMDNFATRVEEKDPEAAALFRSYNIPSGTAVSLFQSLTAAPDVNYTYETISGESISDRVQGLTVDPDRNYRVQINEDTGEIIHAWLDKAPEPEEAEERDIPPSMSTEAQIDIEEIMGDRFKKFTETTLKIPGTGGILDIGKDEVPVYSPDGEAPWTIAGIRNEIFSLSQRENISPQQAATKVFEDIEQQERYIEITQEMIDADNDEGADLRRLGAKAGQIFDVENKRFLGGN